MDDWGRLRIDLHPYITDDYKGVPDLLLFLNREEEDYKPTVESAVKSRVIFY